MLRRSLNLDLIISRLATSDLWLQSRFFKVGASVITIKRSPTKLSFSVPFKSTGTKGKANLPLDFGEGVL